MADPLFITTMTDPQREGWIAFKEVITKFLGNNKDPNYKQIVKRMLKAFQALGEFESTFSIFPPRLLSRKFRRRE